MVYTRGETRTIVRIRSINHHLVSKNFAGITHRGSACLLYARINTGPQRSVDRSIQYSNIPPMGIRILLLVLLLPSTIQARPVSYSGGSTIMLFSDDRTDSVYKHYSPNYKYTIGIEMIDAQEQGEDHARFRFTYLLDRKNTRHSQSNLYFESGLSAGSDKENFYGLMGDWETRQYFVGFGAREFASDTRSHQAIHSIRLCAICW